jgi:hypothetical protein
MPTPKGTTDLHSSLCPEITLISLSAAMYTIPLEDSSGENNPNNVLPA